MLHRLLLALGCLSFTAQAQDTLRVVSHQAAVVVTDPAKGFREYPGTVSFPSGSFRQVTLRVRFGCPDSMRCADWDYLDHIYLRKKGTDEKYEIGRMLTPYGGAFGKNWSFEWTADITDFRSLLSGEAEIVYYHSGYEPNQDRGWKITVEFEFVKGTPVTEPLAVHKIYDASYRYGNKDRSIEADLKPYTLTVGKATRRMRLVVFHTGHGMDKNGCGEFCSRYREVRMDGALIDRRDIWKKCGDNPLYPQAGTWVLDRAYWCPGDLQQPDAYDLTVAPSSKHTVDIDMEPYQSDDPNVNEVITAYLIEYGPVKATVDAAVADVLAPTDKQVHARHNPVSFGPRVLIRNLGTAPLTSLTIRYGTKGFPAKTFSWKGKLSFNQTEEVRLPGTIDGRPGQNSFEVTLLSPNGKKDAWPGDNTFRTSFTQVPVYPQQVVVALRTNKQASHNFYSVKNSEGKVVFERKNLKDNTDYRDTLRLEPGAYELALADTAGDGLEFWYNVRGGRGTFMLMDAKGHLLKAFESDFGSSVYHAFEVRADAPQIAVAEPSIGLFPTRTKGKTTLDYLGNEPEQVEVQIITDEGAQLVERHVYENLKEGVFEYDLSYRKPQRYYLRVFVKGVMKYNKRIRVGQ